MKDVLVELCRDWGVKINVQKSVIMHERKKSVPRCNASYVVDAEEIPYMYQCTSTWAV